MSTRTHNTSKGKRPAASRPAPAQLTDGALFQRMACGKAQSAAYVASVGGVKVLVVTDQYGRPKNCFIRKA